MIKSNINKYYKEKNNNSFIKTIFKETPVWGKVDVGKKQIFLHIVISLSFIVISFVLLLFAKNRSGFAAWYSEKIYSIWLNTMGRISSFFDFSVIEMIMISLAGYVTFSIFKFVIRNVLNKEEISLHNVIKKKDATLYNVLKKMSKPRCILMKNVNLLFFASMIFLIFTLNAGMNYYRHTLSEYIGLDQKEYTVEELKSLCIKLTEDVNQWSGKVKRNEQGLFIVDADIEERAVEAMDAVGKKYDILDGYYPKPKPLLFSWILSYEHLSGIFNPFTLEANYNADMTPYNIPFTICHELSHTKGFMREDEANFIAYLACISVDEPDFQYSGALRSWINSTNLLYSIDATAYQEVRNLLNKEVLYDLKENSQFWNRYEGKVSNISEKVNNTYLNVNGQSDGIKSYNRMVDLLIAYYRPDGL